MNKKFVLLRHFYVTTEDIKTAHFQRTLYIL